VANPETLTRSELQLGAAAKALHDSDFFFMILDDVERLLRCTSAYKNRTYSFLVTPPMPLLGSNYSER
jgi:hypothetical protein